MASLQDIKARRIVTEKTSQITKAMNMVSASKLKKTEKSFDNYKKYIKAMESCILNISKNTPFEHPFLVKKEIKTTGIIIVTTDRGLAGSYNNSVYKLLNELINSNTKVGVIGKKGFSYCEKKKYVLLNEKPIQIRDDVNFLELKPLSELIIDQYLSGEIDEVYFIYNNYINTLIQEPTVKKILPIDEIEGEASIIDYEYDQGPEKTLNTILPMYVETLFYGIILNAKVSEHASRMTAMKKATDNAKEVIEKLTLLYNRARQSAITSDLIDIIAGSGSVE